MVRFREMSWFSIAVLFLVSSTGCASLKNAKSSQFSDAPAGQVYFSSTPKSLNSLSFSRWLGPVTERDKIRYLLERVAASHFRFIRNGETHDSQEARQWLLYKMSHWVTGVATAEDFVDRVASYSQKTGKPYLVEFPDGKVYSLGSVLKNELLFFEQHRTQLLALATSSLPTPHQVKAPPPAVAGTSG